MAKDVKGTAARVVDESGNSFEDKRKPKDKYARLGAWVMSRVGSWQTWRDSEYKTSWDEWERLWRGIFAETERLRQSERSTVVNPALSEAVENGAAELEEAVFGRGADFYDLSSPQKAPKRAGYGQKPVAQAVSSTISAPMGAMPGPTGFGGQMPVAGVPGMGTNVPGMGTLPGFAPPPVADPAADLDFVRQSFKEDLAKVDFVAACVKSILYGGIFGSGFAEVVLEDVKSQVPERLPNGQLVANTKKYTCAKLRALNPRNCVWDPSAESISTGLGFAIVEKIGKHLVIAAQKDGTYRKGVDLFESPPVETTDGNTDVAAGKTEWDEFTAKQVKYFGLVPKSLLNPPEDADDADTTLDASSDDYLDVENDELVEAIVIVVNDNNVAKAEPNPFAQQDRPIVHFPWDIVPGRLLGRGICEKGASMQKILDTEIRARLDSLALVTAPMMGVDANRIPRGFKFKVRPGGSVLTNGKPSEVMEPFKFGQLDPNHWQNAQDLRGMVQQATGSVDAARLAQGAGDARSGAMSMALGPIIKRYKRVQVHFLDEFLMPALEKILWRNMQFSKERYPAVEFKLRPASTMGIMQREYETNQMTSLLSSMQPGTPEHRVILTGVVANTSIPNREKLIKMIDGQEERAAAETAAIQQAQNDPMLEQVKRVSFELEIAEKKAKIAKLAAETAKLQAEAREIAQTSEVEALQTAMKGIYALPQEQQAAEFDRRLAIVQQMMEGEKLKLERAKVDEKRRDRESNERITEAQIRGNLVATAMKQRGKRDQQSQRDEPRPDA